MTTLDCGWCCADARAGITLVAGDITDEEALGRALDEHEITRVVHLAALQVPFCRADPAAGARVNVLGTVAVFEAVKARRDRIGGLDVRQLDGRLLRSRSSPAPESGGAAVDALRRLQARQRGDGADLLAGRGGGRRSASGRTSCTGRAATRG